MKIFTVAQGTKINVIRKANQDWNGQEIVNTTTKNPNVFQLEDFVISEKGIDDRIKPACGSVAQAYFNAGWYGIKQDNFVMLVRAELVKLVC